MKRIDEKEFAKFIRASGEPSREVSDRLRAQITGLLSPSLSKTVAKLFGFHVLGSLVTLTFCPQFGFSLTGSQGFMPYLMRISPGACLFFCGITWMLIGQALTYFLLSMDEQRVLGNTRWGISFSVVGLSLLVFGCLGRLEMNDWLGVWGMGALLVISVFNGAASIRLRRISELGKAKFSI